MGKMCDVLKARLKEEASDVGAYASLINAAEKDGDMALAKTLKSIAYDEYTHAMALHDVIEKKEEHLDPETDEAWEMAKRTFKDM